MSPQTMVIQDTVMPQMAPTPRSIMFLIDQLSELGGAERMMFDLADSLSHLGYRVTIVTFRDQVSEEAYKLAEEIIVLPIRSCFSIEALKAIQTLVRTMRERKVCLLQTYCESSDLIGAIASRFAGIRNVCSSRRDMGILRTRKHRLAYKVFAPLYSRVLSVSERVGRQHQQMDGIAAERIVVIHNGVDLARYDGPFDTGRIRRSVGIPTDKFVVTTVSNVNRWKGLDVFIRAAALVHQENHDAIFTIAGDWTDSAHLQELRALAATLAIAHCVYFLGRVEDVPALLRASEIFVLLSRSEGFPNVVIEAMAASLPVVATDVGGTSEALLDRITGYLVPDEDYHAAASRILSLLAHAHERRSMGAKGRLRAEEQFSRQTMVKRHLEVYDAILAQ